jgi:hypothetical protein
MPSSISQDFIPATHPNQNISTIGDRIQNAASEGVDILRENPVLTLVAVGVLGFAIGTLAGRSSVRQRRALDANLDSLQRAFHGARAGTVDAVGSLRKALKDEGLLPDQLSGRVKQKFSRLLTSITE